MRPTTDISRFFDGEPGVYLNVPMKEYITYPAVGRSALSVVARKSPLHLKTKIEENEGKEHTPSTSLGTMLHCAILEPKVFEERFVQEPYKLDKRRKKDKEIYELLCKKYGAENIMSEDDWKNVQGMKKSVEENENWQFYTKECEVWREVTFLWYDKNFPNLLCKARPDILAYDEENDAVYIPDIKTTVDARFFMFGKSAYDYGYYLQAEHYKQGAQALNLNFIDFVFFAVESSSPYCCIPYHLDEAAWDLAYDDLFYAKALYSESIETGEWKGYDPNPQFLSLPQYAFSGARQFDVE